METEPADLVLTARGITKSFPGVRALEAAELTLRSGRVMGLVGENGAGKSTLMNILAGVFPPDAGTILLDGRPVRFGGPRDAREQGIAIIFQELSLLPNLTVAENIFLGREPQTAAGLIEPRAMNAEARVLLTRVALPVEPTTPVSALRLGQQQLVEIARTISTEARVLIMDEPTSALSDHEVEVLFGIIRELKRQGVALVYVTHKFGELARIADDLTIMRDGRVVAARAWTDFGAADIVRLMVGRDQAETSPGRRAEPGRELLRAEGISLGHPEREGAHLVHGVDLHVCRGEVLSIFGLMGAGRTELLETLFGLHPGRGTARITIDDMAVTIRSASDAIAHGLALAPEDRKEAGLVLEMSVQHNASLACLRRAVRFGLLSDDRERELIRPLFDRFRVKTPSLRQLVRHLSGGNQQKVILAKWLATAPKVLLLDEPTRGIDIQAKQEIHALIAELARGGLGVIVVSSELPEILAISDRILVLCQGRKTAEFARDEATPEALMNAALPRAA